MPKCKTGFNNKFRLLCSQESCDEIKWSSSDSSEYENVSNCDKPITSKQQNRKRKRKKRVPKNISNLDITIIDAANEKELARTEKRVASSPILSSQYHPPYKYNIAPTSPIICPKTINTAKTSEITPKSPILVLKTASPVYSPKVKKKLFTSIENVDKLLNKNTSALCYGGKQKHEEFNLVRRHTICTELNNNKSTEKYCNDKSDNNYTDKDQSTIKKENNTLTLDDSLGSLKSSKDWKLVNKVKSYFDSHFSSESASQVTIQDSLTPKNNSRSSDDIIILNTITQINFNKNSIESIKEELNTDLFEPKSKKIRYKKDGLANRLNILLKKHNANISLWQHERFLAANSNFIIPKGEHLLFLIQNVEIKYGCFLLQTKNIENERFLILIHKNYVNNSNISKDKILKVYEPHRILDFNKDFKLLINVCKFECEDL